MQQGIKGTFAAAVGRTNRESMPGRESARPSLSTRGADTAPQERPCKRSRRTAVAIGLAAMCAAGLTAQTQETKTTTNTKVEIKGGKDVTVNGCLDRNANGDYILTRARANRHEPSQYALITSEDLSKHVGERLGNPRQDRDKRQRQGLSRVNNKNRSRQRHGSGSYKGEDRRRDWRARHAVSV